MRDPVSEMPLAGHGSPRPARLRLCRGEVFVCLRAPLRLGLIFGPHCRARWGLAMSVEAAGGGVWFSLLHQGARGCGFGIFFFNLKAP